MKIEEKASNWADTEWDRDNEDDRGFDMSDLWDCGKRGYLQGAKDYKKYVLELLETEGDVDFIKFKLKNEE